MGRNPSCTPEIRAMIVRMYCSQKQTMRAIAGTLGVSKTMVFQAIKAYGKTGTCENHKRQIRGRKTTQIEDRQIVHLSKKNPFLSSMEILRQVQPQITCQISSATVRRRLLEAGLRGCIAKRKPLVSKKKHQGTTGIRQTTC